MGNLAVYDIYYIVIGSLSFCFLAFCQPGHDSVIGLFFGYEGVSNIMMMKM